MPPSPPSYRCLDEEDSCLVFVGGERRAETDLRSCSRVTWTRCRSQATCRAAATATGSIGRGAADMKAGIAVMLEVMGGLADGSLVSDLDVGFLFFGREEIATDEGALLPLLHRRPELARASLAVMMEPTANALEIGCLGNLNAAVRVRGEAAHSARPWFGDNAIHRAITALASIADLPVRDVEIDGLVFREVVNVTRDRRGRRGERDPRSRRRHDQLPLRPEPHAGGGGVERSASSSAIARSTSPSSRTLHPAPSTSATRSLSGSVARATWRSVRSRPGPRWPSSPRPASTPSTSAPATRGTLIGTTSRSTWPLSFGRTSCCRGS